MSEDVQSLTLQVSEELKACLEKLGAWRHFAAAEILFHEGDDNAGVFLTMNGTVCLRVKGLPILDRMFAAGSLLGLPSTMTGRPYTLTAAAISDADVVQVTQDDFLRLPALDGHAASGGEPRLGKYPPHSNSIQTTKSAELR
jgi:CRP-like cAMP-binding protein